MPSLDASNRRTIFFVGSAACACALGAGGWFLGPTLKGPDGPLFSSETGTFVGVAVGAVVALGVWLFWGERWVHGAEPVPQSSAAPSVPVSGQGSRGQGSPGQGSRGQGSPGQGSPGQGSPGRVSPGRVSPSQHSRPKKKPRAQTPHPGIPESKAEAAASTAANRSGAILVRTRPSDQSAAMTPLDQGSSVPGSTAPAQSVAAQ
jgi:hypothetical protein